MKLFFYLLIFVLNFSFACSNEWIFEAKKITTTNDNQIIIANGNAEAVLNDQYQILAEKITYYKDKKKIIAENDVNIIDLKKKLKINSENIEFNIIKNYIYSQNNTTFILEKDLKIDSSNVKYDIKNDIISSNKKSIFTDSKNNIIKTKSFKFNNLIQELSAIDIEYIDSEKNNYYLEKGVIKTKNNVLAGKDIEIYLNPENSENVENEPRLKGNSLNFFNNKSKITKGVFTTCRNNDDNCPPWKIAAKEIIHDKDKKKINYKNAWLSLYNVPVLYFPKFFHPDPTVERQSGFLIPQMNNSKKLGSSIKIPYFHAINENSDLTFIPRIFSENETLIQTEYRIANKNSNHIFDISYSNDESINKDSKSHFFSNSVFNLDNSLFDTGTMFVKIERVSMDNYIELYGLEGSSPLIEDATTLENIVQFTGENNDFFLDTSFEVYEKMNNTNSDRYEFIYPNYYLSKNFEIDSSIFQNLDLISYGNQKKFSTNIYEGLQVNDLIFSAESPLLSNKINNNFKFLVKNVNTNGKNSEKYKSQTQGELMTNLIYDLSLNLKKEEKKYNKFLTPKVSLRYSPNSTKNIQSLDRKLDINNLYSLNRIGTSDDIEGGASITIGNKFELKNKNSEQILGINLGTVFNDKNKKQLPLNNTLRNSQSDFVGNIIFKPNTNLEFDYNFSLDNQLDDTNLHQFKTKFKINNFVNTFEFYEENNEIGLNSYYSNTFDYSIDKNNLLSFKTRKNKTTNLTEFYDLIYEYKNDCLIASIKYKKEFYSSSVLEPSENLFFTLTLVPLGSTSTDNVMK